MTETEKERVKQMIQKILKEHPNGIDKNELAKECVRRLKATRH